MQILEKFIVCFLTIVSLSTNATANSKSFNPSKVDFYKNKIQECKKDTQTVLLWGRKWEKYAQKKGNTAQIIEAKRATLYYHKPEEWLTIAEEIKAWAITSKNNNLIIEAYTGAASTAYACKKIKEACNYFMQADQLLLNTNDDYSKFKVKFGIALCKYYLGYYNEALSLSNNCISYFETHNDRGYINSLHLKANCLIKLQNFQDCQSVIQLGKEKTIELEIQEMEKYFELGTGIIQYYLKQDNYALKTLQKSMQDFKEIKDDNAKDVIDFYLGQLEWKKNNTQKAISHYLQLVKRYRKTKQFKADLRQSIEHLIDFYKKTNNITQELEMVNLLLEIDKKNTAEYKYLITKIVKEYDTKILLQTKKHLEQKIQNHNVLFSASITSLLVAISIIIYRKKTNKNEGKKIKSKEKDNQDLKIKPELEEQLVKNLERFERSKKYLEKEMTLNKMASFLNSNTKYVTKIIAKHRGKGTIEYLSDLKIEYIVERLQNEKKYRLYTNKALGEEIGFGSTQNFTKAFKTRMNMTPTEFIKQLSE